MAWYNTSWLKRMKITIPASAVGSNLTNFPCHVHLGDTDFADLHTSCLSSGADIVVTISDGTTKLDRELVFINTTSETGELYFRAPSLSSSVDNEFYIYYDNSGGSETNDTGTWRSEYKLVSHLHGSTPTNSTAYGVDGTINGSISTGVTGGFGDSLAYDFPGAGSTYVDYADDPDWDITGAISVQCYHNDDTNNFMGYVSRMSDGADKTWGFMQETTSNYRARVAGNNNFDSTATTPISTDTWYSAMFTYSDSDNRVRFYQNGSQLGSDVSCTVTLAASAYSIKLGEEGNGDWYNGTLDEVRIYAGELTSDWASLDYALTKNFGTTVTVGAEEDVPTGTSIPVFLQHYRNQGLI